MYVLVQHVLSSIHAQNLNKIRRKLHNSPDTFQCTSTSSSGEHTEHLKVHKPSYEKWLKHHLMMQYVEILCKFLMCWKFYTYFILILCTSWW
jgi:hypothetical protein